MIRATTRAITRPITRAIRRALEKTRYLIDLNGTNAHYELAQPKSFAGDFRVAWEVACGSQPNMMILGEGIGFSNHIIIKPLEVEFRIAATRLYFTVALQDNIYHSCAISRVGGVLTLTVDGVAYPEDTATTNTHAFSFDVVGQENTSVFGDGIIANAKFTDLGSQLFSTFTSLDAGSSYVAGVLTLVQNAGQDFAVSDVSIVSGTKYTIDYEVTSQDIDTDGELKITTNTGNTTKVLLPHTIGEHSVTFTADANYTMTLRLGNTSNGRVVVGDSWSVRETDNIVTTTFALDEPTANTEASTEGNNSITYNNIAEADRELYQEEATEFVNISPVPQQLPAIITKA